MTEKKIEEFDDDSPISTVSSVDEANELKLDDVFAGFLPGYKMVVYRMLPKWAKGHLETIEFDGDEQVSFEDILAKWGGQKLRLRVYPEKGGKIIAGADVDVRSHPPLYKRQPIFRDSYETNKQSLLSGDENYSPPHESPKPAPQAPQNNFVELLGALQKMRSEDIKTFRSLFIESNPAPPQGAQTSVVTTHPPATPFGEMVTMIKQFKQMQDLLTPASPVTVEPQVHVQDDQAQMFGQITDLIKVLVAKNGAPQAPPPQPRRITPPAKAMSGNLGSAPLPAQDPQAKKPMSSIVADMEVPQIKEFMLTTLAQMPQNKREAVMSEFAEELGIVDDDDEWEDDDPSEFDGADLSRARENGAFGEAENTDDARPGRRVSTDESDDSANR